MKNNIRHGLILILLVSLWISCSHEYTPKPRGYFRISFPEKKYLDLQTPWNLPYHFKIPSYANPQHDSLNLDQPNWITINIPENKAQIHLSYKTINNNLSTWIEESRTLAYKHTQKATSIEERVFVNPKTKVYGTVYYINGNAASPMQFYLTDSVHHFLRGSLYIREVPNSDSLQPVINFLSEDIIEMIETTQWKASEK